MTIRSAEAIAASAPIRSIQIGTQLTARMIARSALINIHALLAVLLRYYVALIAVANVAAIGEVLALLLTSTQVTNIAV